MQEYVVTVHGIATAGKWQDDIAIAFAPHFKCLVVRYPQYRWMGAFKLLQEPLILVLAVVAAFVVTPEPHLPSGREWLAIVGVTLVAYMATYYRRTLAFNRVIQQAGPYANRALRPHTHLIAHSFGTYLTGRALRTRSDFFVGRIVYVGCVLPRTFPWSTLKGSGTDAVSKFLAVRNEIGRKDYVVYLAWLMSPLIRGLGIAGYNGFSSKAGHVHDQKDPNTPCTDCSTTAVSIHNIDNPELGHSDTFVTSGYAETYWLPFLWGIEPSEYHEFLELCKAATALERQWSAAARSKGHVDPRLITIEQQLHAKTWRWTDGTFGVFVEREVMSRFPGTAEELKQSVALAIRGVWDSVAQALEAYQARAVRASEGQPADAAADAAIGWLNPHRAVRRAVNDLPQA